jgi:hypothetical protein
MIWWSYFKWGYPKIITGFRPYRFRRGVFLLRWEMVKIDGSIRMVNLVQYDLWWVCNALRAVEEYSSILSEQMTSFTVLLRLHAVTRMCREGLHALREALENKLCTYPQ